MIISHFTCTVCRDGIHRFICLCRTGTIIPVTQESPQVEQTIRATAPFVYICPHFNFGYAQVQAAIAASVAAAQEKVIVRQQSPSSPAVSSSP